MSSTAPAGPGAKCQDELTGSERRTLGQRVQGVGTGDSSSLPSAVLRVLQTPNQKEGE